ncbi:hypothetical protein TNCV_3777441 [Trichonephila clavipes]|nr:hypothetical protein TNCV_3777441 [Trichonephila clavipes]
MTVQIASKEARTIERQNERNKVALEEFIQGEYKFGIFKFTWVSEKPTVAEWSRSRTRSWRVEGSIPSTTKEPPFRGADTRSICRGSKFSRWCGVENWRVEGQLWCRPHHLTDVQNYEVHYQWPYCLIKL